jgi:hydrogenase assembly chaperone HypC/HupF
MCFVIPGKIIKIDGDFAIADFAGEKRKISTKFLKVSPGDYVICAGDIAADIIPKEKALKIIEAVKNANKK